MTAPRLLRGEDPLLVNIDADELISVRERCCNRGRCPALGFKLSGWSLARSFR